MCARTFIADRCKLTTCEPRRSGVSLAKRLNRSRSEYYAAMESFGKH